MKTLDFSPTTTHFLKAVAITAIVLHNFLHWLPPTTGENEIDFSRDRLMRLWEFVSSDPASFPKMFFCYFGHLTIVTFLFVSGYGLAKSLEKRQTAMAPFVLEKILDLYKLLLIAACFALAAHWAGIWPWPQGSFIGHMVKYFTISHNFSKTELFSFCGPWWFFNLMMQLYLVFPLLFFPLRKYGSQALVAIMTAAYALIYGLAPLAEAHDFPIFGNFLGHVPEFTLGVYLGLAPAKKLPALPVVAGLVVFGLGNYFEAFFPLTFLAFAVITTPAFLALERLTPWPIHRAAVRLGALSPIVFVTNGPLRQVLIDTAKEAPLGGQYLHAAGHLALALAVSWAIHSAMARAKLWWNVRAGRLNAS